MADCSWEEGIDNIVFLSLTERGTHTGAGESDRKSSSLVLGLTKVYCYQIKEALVFKKDEADDGFLLWKFLCFFLG